MVIRCQKYEKLPAGGTVLYGLSPWGAMKAFACRVYAMTGRKVHVRIDTLR